MAVSLTSRVAWLVPALLIVEACASGDRPTAPRPGPEFAISDGVHESGTPGFYFLPPMVAQPTVSGTFDADITTLNPAIAICDITNGSDDNCGGAGGAAPVIGVTTPSPPADAVQPPLPPDHGNRGTHGAGAAARHTPRAHRPGRAGGGRGRRGWRRRARASRRRRRRRSRGAWQGSRSTWARPQPPASWSTRQGRAGTRRPRPRSRAATPD